MAKTAGNLVVITGGSAGLGLSLATDYVRNGSDTVIIARTQETLEAAKISLELHRRSSNQLIASISADCRDVARIKEAVLQYGVPDILITCAGKSLPRLFLDLVPEDFAQQVSDNYLSAINTIHPVFAAMVDRSRNSRPRHRTRIVLVSSTAAFVGLSGYSAYAPSKVALRSLADHLRQETLLYPNLRDSLRIHCVCPSTIYTQSFLNEEQKIKPQVTKVLEEDDAGQTPEQVAKEIIRALKKEKFLISTDFPGSLAKSTMLGPSPSGSFTSWKSNLGRLVMLYYCRQWDRAVRKYGDQQHKITAGPQQVLLNNGKDEGIPDRSPVGPTA